MRRAAQLAFVALLAAATATPHTLELPYDGRFTFVRLRWAGGGLSSRGWSGGGNPASPGAEQHLAQILNELTVLDIHTDGSRILTLDDPELFPYPSAFMWGPGFWTLPAREAEGFRAYLLKGGFAVFEDFDGRQQWVNFEAQMKR